MPSPQKKSAKRSAPSAPKKQASKDKRQSKTAPVQRASKSKDNKRAPDVKRPTADPPPKEIAVTTKPKTVSKKSKSLDKPKSAVKPPAPSSKSAGRQHPKAVAVPKATAKVQAKTGQKGAIAGDTNANLVIAYGSAHRAKSVGPSGLLTARYHRSSGSPSGEAVTPPYGDVRTMVCDVSPVPSDVESIDFSNTASVKPPPDRRGLFGRSQQTLRVGHHDKKTHAAKGIRHSDSHPGDAPKSEKVQKADEDCGQEADTVRVASDSEETAVKNEIAVRIVPDSARQKSVVSAKEPTSVVATSHSKAHVKEVSKPQKVTTKAPQTNGSKAPNQKAPSSNGKPLKSSKPVKIEKLQLTKKPKTSTENGSNIKVAVEATSDGDNTKEAASGTVEVQIQSESNGDKVLAINVDDLRNQQDKDKVLENSENEKPPTIRIKADEECCKAYAILNSKGIRVSLHTLRRALLTPTEYRLLQSTGQITDS